jgi:hypothetical protein
MSVPLIANQAALDIGWMAQRMCDGYFKHAAVIRVATDPRAVALSPELEPGQVVPVDRAYRKDGTPHLFHFNYFLSRAVNDSGMADELRRVLLVGALLTVGDALEKQGYFDHAPELKLLRHLRHGVAHGNTFRIGKKLKHEAHNRLAWVKSDTKAIFEITPNLQGQQVLFDFLGPADVLDLLQSVSTYLTRIGTGQPLRP